MVKPAPSLVKSTTALLFAAPVVLLSACAPPGQVPSEDPGTTPSIWTGSPAPSTAAGGHGADQGDEGADEDAAGQGDAHGTGSLVVPMLAADGAQVATATFDFEPGHATVTIETVGSGALTPGFHGVHVHSVGVCEANSVAPTGGAPGDFLSAGGHFQVPGHSGHPASGDLASLNVLQDGSGKLVTTTDAFTEEDLLAGEQTAIMIHSGADNFGNIPERYAPAGPDQTTMTTGDAGSRVACGVITGE